MEFGKNILKNESAYYELHNASIAGGILTLQAGGSAKYTITSDYLPRATEYFLVNLVVDPFTDNYIPKAQARIHFVTADEKSHYNYSVFPVETSSGVYSQQIQFTAGEYKEFTFEITSREQTRFLVWELCPEAADDDIQTIIDGVEQSLPRLLFDYNTWPLTVNQAEATIGLITFRLLDQTDLQGHFQLTYVASEACTLTLRFKDNGATELFSPILYDLHAGRGSIGVPHAYLDRLAGIHTVTVTAQTNTGTLVIDTRGLLFTIDGGYLAERMLDIGVDVRDISMRQLKENYGPDEIWIVGIEAGEALVRKRPYNPKSTITFEPQYSVGRAIDAAIEFDGQWLLRSSSDNHTIETEEFPWVFWIDATYKLWAQLGNDESTKIQLDSNVDQISVCRGYNSMYDKTQDQGLVCAYIIDDAVYYKTYNYSADSDGKYWSDRFLLYNDQKVLKVQIHRLNDYRLGFCIITSTEDYWLITDRTYVSQATPPEIVSVSMEQYPALAAWAKEPDAIMFDCVGDKENMQLVATANYDMRLRTDYPLDIFDFVGLDKYEHVKAVTVKDNKFIVSLKKFPEGNVQITCNNAKWQYYIPNVGYYSLYKQQLYFEIMKFKEAVHISTSLSTAKLTCSGINKINHREEEHIQLNMKLTQGNLTSSALIYSEVKPEEEHVKITMKINNTTLSNVWVGDQPV